MSPFVYKTKIKRRKLKISFNYREGRPRKYTTTQLHHAIELLDFGKTYRQVEAMTGISKSTLIRAKKA